MKNRLLLIVPFAILWVGCGKDPDPNPRKEYFSLWNPCKALAEQWYEAGYHVISMRDDFKTIYGSAVKKVPFQF